MKVNEFLMTTNGRISLQDEVIIVDLFRWLLMSCEDYDNVERITIRDNRYITVKYKGLHTLETYPLYFTVQAQLMPALIEEFRLIKAAKRIWDLQSPVLKEISLNPEVFYEYFNLHGKFPINEMILLHNFITKHEDVEEEDEIEYLSTAELVT